MLTPNDRIFLESVRDQWNNVHERVALPCQDPFIDNCYRDIVDQAREIRNALIVLLREVPVLLQPLTNAQQTSALRVRGIILAEGNLKLDQPKTTYTPWNAMLDVNQHTHIKVFDVDKLFRDLERVSDAIIPSILDWRPSGPA